MVAGRGLAQITDIDGAKLILADGSWFLVRPSGTEPLLRIYIESDSEKALQEIEDAVTKLIDEH